jgi:GT2 family glycosyltransferase
MPEPPVAEVPALRATVVIATRDRPAALSRCIESLLTMNGPEFDIVVVDNAPATTETEELVGKLHAGLGDRIRYVREDQPGLAAAHNRGLREVTGGVAAFTDDDVVVDADWLPMLLLGFDDPRVGCVTGLIAPLELETQVQLWIEDATGFGKGLARREFAPDEAPDDDPLYPFAAGRFGSGANMAFRTDALRAMGGFDAALGAGTKARGGDDLNAFARVVLHGHKLVYEPAAIVWHQHRRDIEGLRRQAFGYGAGLTAYLTSIVVEKPARLPAIAKRAPGGLRYALAPSSPKNARVPSSQPRDLKYRELAGMALGPLLYTASRRSTRAR